MSRLLGFAPSLAALRSRFGGSDLEHEVIRNRVLFSIGFWLYLRLAGATEIWQIRWGLLLYAGFAGCVVVHRLISPAPSRARRLLGMSVDIAALSYTLYLGGASTAVFYPLYLWVTFGYGFRFGNKYLFVAMALAMSAFAAVIVSTPFWQHNRALSIGLLSGLLVLPLYTSTLIRSLSEAKREAEEANQAKSMLLARVSHELRTPLHAIIGMGHLLRTTVLNPEQLQMTRTIAAAGRSLQSLIDALLDLSRLEAQRMSVQVEDFDLFALIAEIRSVIGAQAAATGVQVAMHVTTRTPRMLRGDRRHLHAVLLNLGGNAVKFTERGAVMLAVDAAEQSAAGVRLRFSVADTGVGIAPEAIGRIFEPFTQADETIGQRYGGTGLGLAICKRLVELMGGEIGVASKPGAGSTFWFSLEVRQPEDSESLPRPAGRQRVILLSGEDGPAAELSERLASCDVACTAVLNRWPAAGPPQIGALIARAVGDTGSDHDDRGYSAILIDERGLRADVEAVAAVLQSPHLGMPPLILIPAEPITGLPSTARSRLFVTVLPADFDAPALQTALAIARASREIESGPVIPAQPQCKLRILVADDNLTNQLVITKILEKAGHETEVVANGEEALDALDRTPFDLVLMDLNMPVMDGIEATKLYRFASLGQKRVPILAMTADATTAVAQRCSEAGMDGCITKPADPVRLLARIQELVAPDRKLELADRTPAVAELARISDIASHPRFRPKDPVLDQRVLRDLEALGGGSFVAALIDHFVADAEGLVAEMIAAARGGDAQAFRTQAHALRSAAVNLGARSLVELCAGSRKIRADELADHGDSLALRLTDELQRVRGALFDYRSAASHAER